MKTHPNSTEPLSRSPAGEEDIANLAYEIWIREGQPEGRELQNWLQAERELRGDLNGNQSEERRSGGLSAAAPESQGDGAANLSARRGTEDTSARAGTRGSRRGLES